MRCSECKAVAFDRSEKCERCGAPLASPSPRRWPEPAPFSLTFEERDAATPGDQESREDWGYSLDQEIEDVYGLPPRKDTWTTKGQWGGFSRRACAFLIDLWIILLLSGALFYTSYVGYTVGLAAHYRQITWGQLSGLFPLLAFAWFCLVGGYFVLFHGMQGMTIGKWLLGIRVVGLRRSHLSYPQAFLRWLAAVGLGPLGFLWVLCSRDKRAWHDYLARTWVIRDHA